MTKPDRSQSARRGAGLQRPAGERLGAMATFAKVVELNGFSVAARDLVGNGDRPVGWDRIRSDPALQAFDPALEV